jgi:hypothetical protein
MQHVRAPLKGLSTKNAFCIGLMVIPIFQYRTWLYSIDQKFHGDDEKTREFWFWGCQWPTAIMRPKSQNSNIRHDGILSVGNFMLMINNHFTLFQLPGILLKTKKCASYFRGNTQFPIILVIERKSKIEKKKQNLILKSYFWISLNTKVQYNIQTAKTLQQDQIFVNFFVLHSYST